MIYFDNAATTKDKPHEVIEAVSYALTHFGNANRGAHEDSLVASLDIFKTRKKLTELFGNASPSHIIFSFNATDALNTVLTGLIKEGSRVITTVTEHNSVLRPLYRLKRERGVALTFIGIDEGARLDMASLENALQEGADYLVISHASNVSGNVVDIDRVAELCKHFCCLLIVDAAQSTGSIKINMQQSGIDILCFTGHKGLFGPQGTGGIALNGDFDIEPFRVGGSGVQSYLHEQPLELPTHLEAGTLNGHGIAGLSAALDFISRIGIDAIHEKEMELANHFLEGIRDIEGIKLYGDFASRHVGIVSLNLGCTDSAIVSDVLSQSYKIATRPGAHCAPLIHKALHTDSQGVVRFSFSYFNTVEEVDLGIRALKEISKHLS